MIYNILRTQKRVSVNDFEHILLLTPLNAAFVLKDIVDVWSCTRRPMIHFKLYISKYNAWGVFFYYACLLLRRGGVCLGVGFFSPVLILCWCC